MTDNVTQFPGRAEAQEPEELIIVCECGCRTMYVLTSGWIECSSCGNRMEDDVTAYRDETVTEVSKPEEIRDRHAEATEDLAFRRTISKASASGSAAVVVFNMDGGVFTWSIGAETEEQREWLRVRVGDLMESLAGVKE